MILDYVKVGTSKVAQGILAATCLFFATTTFAQSTDTEAETEAAPSRGIVFLKPPSSPILTAGSQTSEVLLSIDNDNLRDLLKAANLSVVRRGFGSRYEVRLSGDALALPFDLRPRFAANKSAFSVIDNIKLNSFVQLSAPWNLRAFKSGEIRTTQIEVSQLDLEWGGIKLSGTGLLDVDQQGLVDGKIDLIVTSWNDDISLSDYVFGTEVIQLDALLSTLAFGGQLTLPMNFEQGLIKIGVLPVGRMPPLRP